MLKFFAKKWVLSQVNTALANIKDKEKVVLWKSRIAKIVAFCQSLLNKLDDNQITDEEADQVVQEAKELFS